MVLRPLSWLLPVYILTTVLFNYVHSLFSLPGFQTSHLVVVEGTYVYVLVCDLPETTHVARKLLVITGAGKDNLIIRLNRL